MSTDHIEIPCPDCDQVFAGPPSGRGSAGFKLGAHRSTKHGYRNPNGKRKPRAKDAGNPESRDGPEGKPTILRIVEDAAAEISERSTKPPTIDELTRAISRGLTTVSVGAASYAAETDPTAITEADKDAIVDYLSLAPAESRDLAYPLARAMGRSKLNARYGRAVVDNIDLASAVTEGFMIGVRWRKYLRLREQMIALAGIPGYPTPNGAVAPGVPTPGVVPTGVAMGPIVDVVVTDQPPAPRGPGAPPMQGIIVTPEMLQPTNGSRTTHAAATD